MICIFCLQCCVLLVGWQKGGLACKNYAPASQEVVIGNMSGHLTFGEHGSLGWLDTMKMWQQSHCHLLIVSDLCGENFYWSLNINHALTRHRWPVSDLLSTLWHQEFSFGGL